MVDPCLAGGIPGYLFFVTEVTEMIMDVIFKYPPHSHILLQSDVNRVIV